MRRRSILATTAVLTAGLLTVAAPAHADVVTDVVVTDVTVVHVTDANFVWGDDYIPWEPEGPATFPSVVTWVSDGYALQGYAPVLAPLADGCTRTLESFAVTFESTLAAQSDLYVGLPAAHQTTATADFTGIGTLLPAADPSTEVWYQVDPANGVAAGTITVTLPSVSDSEDFLGWIGFFEGSATVESVSFGTTVTCPDPVVVNPVPAAAPELAATGVDQASAVVGGSVALAAVLLGLALMLVTRARRRTA
jgi:hypothetical protein